MAKKIKAWIRKKFQPRPKPPLGPYTKPHVCIVKLDPEQALLTQCSVGGLFFDGATACVVEGAGAALCWSTVRGRSSLTTKRGSPADAKPS